MLGAPTGLVGDARLVGIDFRVQNGRLYGVGNAGGIYVIGISEQQRDRDQGVAAVGGPERHVVRRRLQPGRQPAPRHQRHRSEPAAQHRRPGRASRPPGVDRHRRRPDLSRRRGRQPRHDGHRHHRRGLHQQRPERRRRRPPCSTSTRTWTRSWSQSPANAGLLAATGKLKVDAGTAAGFDIYSDLTKGETVSNKGYAALPVGGRSGFYKIDLLTGRASPGRLLPGRIPDRRHRHPARQVAPTLRQPVCSAPPGRSRRVSALAVSTGGLTFP